MPNEPENQYRSPRSKMLARVYVRRALRNWPVLVWAAVIVVVVLLYSRTVQFGEMMGVVETIEEPVAPLETARLKAVFVEVGQRVEKGDVLAQMDTSLIEAELAMRQAELIEARETITGYQQNILQMLRQFEAAVKDAEAALQTTLLNQQRDAALLEVLGSELKRREDLLAKRLVNEQDVSALRAQVAALEQTVQGYPALIAVQERRIADAIAQRENMQKWLRATEGEDPSKAIEQKMAARNETLRATVEMIERRRENYTLRANRDGVVSAILEQPGNVINAGTPIMTIVAEHPEHVIGFLPEVHLTELNAGERVLVWRQSGRSRRVPGVIESISPDVQALPGRVSPIRGQTLRGRRVIVKLEGEHDFIPGETVEIRELRTGWGAVLESWARLFR